MLPELLDDFVTEDNPVRVVDVLVDQLDLQKLGFAGVEPDATGRPSYHPALLLKIYVYGYLNRIQSSRRLELETQRNVELMWLTSRLTPDFKTIARFRANNGTAIRGVCRQFVDLCRQLDLFSEAVVAIDGRKFKAVNSRDKNFTTGKMTHSTRMIEESIEGHLAELDAADLDEPAAAQSKSVRIKDKISALKEKMERLKELEITMNAAPDKEVSLSDLDARAMVLSGGRSGIVGYNLQAAVDTKHHLIVAHEVTNVGNDRAQLSSMAKPAREAMRAGEFTAIADRGYYKGEEIFSCHEAGIVALVPKSLMAAHMTAAHRAHTEWTPTRLIHWGQSIGPATAEAVTRLMAENRHPEHGYRACRGLLSLATRYGKVRLEAACMLALQIGTCRYRRVRDILTNNRD